MTRNGEDFLLSAEENTANLIEPPTEEETNNAITSNLGNVMVLVCGLLDLTSSILIDSR